MSKTAKIIVSVALIVFALVSFFGLGKKYTSVDTYTSQIETLDESRSTVLKVTGASTAASLAISFLPSDWGDAISATAMDICEYFGLVLMAITFEKYMLTVTAFLFFKIAVPAACVLGVAAIFWKKPRFMLSSTGIKLFALGLAMFLAVPVSLQITGMIDRTYQGSVDSQLAEVQSSIDEIQKQADDANVLTKITGGIKQSLTKLDYSLSTFIDTLSVMLVTCFVIPILTFVLLSWIMKLIFEKSLLETLKSAEDKSEQRLLSENIEKLLESREK